MVYGGYHGVTGGGAKIPGLAKLGKNRRSQTTKKKYMGEGAKKAWDSVCLVHRCPSEPHEGGRGDWTKKWQHEKRERENGGGGKWGFNRTCRVSMGGGVNKSREGKKKGV